MNELPPHNLDAEQAVLGSILIDRDAIIEVADFLTPAAFYRQGNGRIFAAMLDLFEKRQPIDVVTVVEALGDDLESVGGAGYIASLGNGTPTAVHVAQYGRIIEQKALCRRLIGAAGKIAAIGYEDGDPDESLDRAQAELFELGSKRSGTFLPLTPLLHEAYDRLEELRLHKGEVLGIPSGFVDLDLLTEGFQPSDLIVIAARPSVGKTSLALNVAEHAALLGKTVGIFSLEMSREQLVQRLFSGLSGVDGDRLRSGFAGVDEWDRVAQAMNRLSQTTVFIDDTPTLTPTELRTRARRLQMEHGLDLAIIDYLQLMHAPTKEGNRVQEVSQISRQLKAVARELRVPLLALSQLSRQPEMRESGEPRLSDLRESGAIEQDADLVIFLWRDKDPDPLADGEVIHFNLAKHRNGPTGKRDLWFKRSQTRFSNYRRMN